MVARYSGAQLPDSATLVSTSEAARVRALQLAGEDEAAFAALTAGTVEEGGPGVGDSPGATDDDRTGDAGRSAALLRVATVPLEMVLLAAELCPLLVRLARDGNQRLRGDALVGIELLKAAASGAAHLVRIDAVVLENVDREQLLDSLEEAEDRLAAVLP
jgi:formiminotetrahydrofolate cyclodeaminase